MAPTVLFTLLLCSVLTAGHVWAKVVDDFSDDCCAEFFYNGTAPRGIEDQTLRRICQQLEVKGNLASFYATLYSPAHRIPIYSAYKFNPFCTHRQDGGPRSWFMEPQLYQRNLSAAMAYASSEDEEVWRNVQAANADYSLTGFARAQLSPSSVQCGLVARRATFTLTNAAPVHPTFLRLHWSQWEEGVSRVLQHLRHGTAYLVTGTVPSATDAIPKRTAFDDGPENDFNRVSVPTHLWTAVCYRDRDDDQRSFSFAYIGENRPDGDIRLMSVAELNGALSDLYHSASQVQVFSGDGCLNIDRPSTLSVFKQLYASIRMPVTDTLSMSDDVVNVLHAATMMTFDYHGNDYSKQLSEPLERPKLAQVTVLRSFSSLEAWFRSSELMKFMFGTACVQSRPFTGPIRTSPDADWLKAQKGSTLTADDDNLAKQKALTTDDSLATLKGLTLSADADAEGLVCVLTPDQTPGCLSSCRYQEEARGYYCSSGATPIPCSPLYSLVTTGGAQCRSGHTCGTHGYSYYWCYTASSWDYCSPPLPLGVTRGGQYCRSNHNCGWYGYPHTWCYTDYDDNWGYCCRSKDRFSALNGKTCQAQHPCGHYGYGYLWCRTTDGSWEYCCTQ
ncbi:uncharacterized protein LOC134457717 [Engraulis encrasicolus]|uniref:uncharacterized protein LOC134457717 n=1 Tax=Engraulis encrasicolus TaxID=184585 RepID=UPI002FD06C86